MTSRLGRRRGVTPVSSASVSLVSDAIPALPQREAPPGANSQGINLFSLERSVILRAGGSSSLTRWRLLDIREGSRMRVLLIEDEPVTAEALALMLAGERCSTDKTGSGEEGIALAKIYDYDIILL